MNSEITIGAQQQLESKIDSSIVPIITRIGASLGIDPENQEIFTLNLANRIFTLYSNKQTQIEALGFIYENKPKDLLEVYQLINVFHLSVLTTNIFTQITRSKGLTPEMLIEYTSMSAKLSSEQSKAMIAMKTYRSGVSITRNVQNNTLNQVHIGKAGSVEVVVE